MAVTGRWSDCRGAGLHRAVEKTLLPAVKMMKIGSPAAVQQHEKLPQDSFPQQDVNPGVQDLVPGGHTYSHQKINRRRLVFRSGAQHDDVELAQSSKTRA